MAKRPLKFRLRFFLLFLVLPVLYAQAVTAAEFTFAPFKKVFIIVFENESGSNTLEQSYFRKLSTEGAYLNHYSAISHPSYPNYVALTSGSVWDLKNDRQRTLDVAHIGDLLEAKGKSWRVYAEGYPGHCFLGSTLGNYARKHVPLLSYKNVQNNPKRCDNIVDARQLKVDVRNGTLPDYMLYIPDNDNNGHDTGVRFANDWLKRTFEPLLKDRRFTEDLLFVLTFDEDNGGDGNKVYTTLWGDSIRPGSIGTGAYTHYSLLRTIEDAFGLGTLGRADEKASRIEGIWR